MLVLCTDSLVQYFQFIHDGHLLGGACEYDLDAYSSQGLCPLQQGGWSGRHGKYAVFGKPTYTSLSPLGP